MYMVNVHADYLSQYCTRGICEIFKVEIIVRHEGWFAGNSLWTNDKRNAADDPADYFDYVMFG